MWCSGRYYGDPVPAQGSLTDAVERVTIDEFIHVVLGSVLAGWGASGRNFLESASMIVSIRNAVEGHRYPGWLDVLVSAAHALLAANDFDRSIFQKLIKLGRRRGSGFLCDASGHPPALFSLALFEVFLPLLKNEEDQIDLVRKYAKIFFPDAREDEMIIRYRSKGLLRPTVSMAGAEVDALERCRSSDDSKSSDGFAPSDNSAEKGPSIVLTKHSTTDMKGKETDVIDKVLEDVTHYATALPLLRNDESAQHRWCKHPAAYHRWVDARLDDDEAVDIVDANECSSKKTKAIFLLDRDDSEWKVSPGLFVADTCKCGSGQSSASQTAPDETFQEDIANKPASETQTELLTYRHFVGHPKSASLFVAGHLYDSYVEESRAPSWARNHSLPKKALRFDDIKHALEEGKVDGQKLAEYLHFTKRKYDPDTTMPQFGEKYHDFFTSLNSITFVFRLYKALASATISLKVVLQRLSDSPWVKQMDVWKGVHGSREQAFACIALFDTGSVNLHPSKFQNVMALSSADSLYINASLLCDPSERSPGSDIRHVIGNVGKHGLLLLVPPPIPQVMTPKLDNWAQIDHPYFDGQVEDTFTRTTLHLSFTDWLSPIDLGRGHRDAEAYVVESVVSVHDNGRWIADLDILESLKNGCGQYDHEFFFNSRCPHSQSTSQDPTPKGLQDNEIVCITNWDEFLERPDTPAVVMTHKNWLARLGITVIGIRRGDRVFLGDKFCAECLKELEAFNPSLSTKALFVV